MMSGMQQTAVQDEFSAEEELVSSPDYSAASKQAAAAKVAPEKAASAFRTISEVADDLGVQQHVLRFWETKFSQVKPLKRGGGRRYYRPEDVALIRRIHHLLYTEGYTIKGVQKLLKGQGRSQIVAAESEAVAAPVVAAAAAVVVQRPVAAPAAPTFQAVSVKPGINDRQKAALEVMLSELKELRSMIRGE